MLELGAGTGKLTTLLVPTGARIVALEPVPGMCTKLAAALGGARGRNRRRDRRGHPPARGLGRRGRRGAGVPLVRRDPRPVRGPPRAPPRRPVRARVEPARRVGAGAMVRALGDRIRTLAAGDEPQVWDDRWRASLRRCALFEPWDSVLFRQTQVLTREGVLDRVASVSFVAAAEPSAQAKVLASVDALLRDDPATAGRDTIDLPYDTEVMWATRRTIEPGLDGVVASVNLNRGGVPKPPVDGTVVRTLGLDGDGHNHARHPRWPDGRGLPLPPGGGRTGTGRRAPVVPGLVRREPHAARHRLGRAPGRRPARAGRRRCRWRSRRTAARADPVRRALRHAVALVPRGPDRADQPQGPSRGRALVREGPARRPGGPRHGRAGRPRRLTGANPARSAAHAHRHRRLQFARHVRRIDGRHREGRRGNRPRTTREALLELHAAARRRRNASALGSHEWEQASADVGRIEVEIARIERTMDPPRV